MQQCVGFHVFTLLFCGLALAGCQVNSVHRDVWPSADGTVVLPAPPVDSNLPATSTDFGEARFGTLIYREERWGEFNQGFFVRDQAPHVEHEPLDLDLLVRIDGNAGSGFDDFYVGREYTPLSAQAGYGVLFRLHILNYRKSTPEVTVTTTLHGDPGKPYYVADLYAEYSIAGREWIEGRDWYILTRIRFRFQSEHPDWLVSGTTFTIADSSGMTMGVPLYKRAE